MHLIIQLLVIILAFVSHIHEAIAQSPYSFGSIVFPVTKHINTTKPLYSIQILTKDYMNNYDSYSNFLIDIDATLIWHDCIPDWKTYPVPCNDEYSQCKDVQTTYSYKSPSCHPTNNGLLPGWGYCSCPVNVANTVTGYCDRTLLNYDYFTMNTSNGKNVLSGVFDATAIGACASSSSFQLYPKDVKGVMAFSSSPYALPTSLNLYDLVKKITAVCLPSNSTAPGVLFSGIGPYYLYPNSDVDIRSLLSYTPLLKHQDSFGYFISVNAILIKKKSIDIPANATTKISTTEPYTILRRDIFTQVVSRFSMVTRQIPAAKPIMPFGVCFSTSKTGKKAGLYVPDIDLSLQGGKTWTISTANSIKQMTNDVACLAFVDGGATSEPAITIGTFQFEDNFVVFDLENSNFGFSSSLLSQKTSCANFNFTQLM